MFGDTEEAPKAGAASAANPITGAGGSGQMGTSNNNYSRPAGQNVSNWLYHLTHLVVAPKTCTW